MGLCGFGHGSACVWRKYIHTNVQSNHRCSWIPWSTRISRIPVCAVPAEKETSCAQCWVWGCPCALPVLLCSWSRAVSPPGPSGTHKHDTSVPLAGWEVQLETTLWCSPVVKELGAKTDISQFYCIWPCDLMLLAPEKVIYFFSLVRKGTRVNSMRAELGDNGVKSFSCSRKEENSYSNTGKWHVIDGNSLEWGKRLGFDGLCWHSLGNPGQNPLAKVKLASERTILSSTWEHSVCKSQITVLCSLALSHKRCFITEQIYWEGGFASVRGLYLFF